MTRVTNYALILGPRQVFWLMPIIWAHSSAKLAPKLDHNSLSVMKWLKHFTDANSNLKLRIVVNEFGLEGYGFYWLCLEIVGQQGENFRIGARKEWQSALTHLAKFDQEKTEKILNRFATLDLIDKKAYKRGALFIPKLQEYSDEYTDKLRRKSKKVVLEVEGEVEEEQKKKEKKTANSLAEQIKPFLENYSESMLTDFSLYWTEPDTKGRERWEKEPTWDIKKRLERWRRQQERWDHERATRQQLKQVDETPTHREPAPERVDSGLQKADFSKYQI